MYADQVASGTKRSIMERLNGDLGEDGRRRQPLLKRQRQVDDKWKHDLFDDNREHPSSKPKVGPKDLRLKLQKKDMQNSYHSGKSGVRDLREKLSGIMQSQMVNNDPPKAVTASGSSIPVKRNVNAVEKPVPETKKVSNPTSVKMTKQKSDTSIEGFLKSLGLEKYIITFKVEEVDMAALMHISEDDLKAIGIPMGPRKKILTSLQSKS
ncbi:hypothetical protein AXF42_Ash006155 [Apostasia shenzhenica]|uniref:SAM domain-containing protein n=1 Tax=Apostasia shenzhenica TaxID=1088818 RepID=A0A2I0B0D4_9ASPA|nr:hypothetical protein AXF42_Ash006155 [Apostasia shenzhenica]